MRLRLIAPAKINWTLEVLGKRPDGYHEVRTILQTIDLWDEVEMELSEQVRVCMPGVGEPEKSISAESNLALRAATALREASGAREGATVVLRKRIPVAAGLGGGSSDAAAALRGLNRLWGLGLSAENLAEVAAGLGSDVPFFLRGGVALGEGRGERLTPLADAQPRSFVLAWPPTVLRDKTARMYGALRAQHYSDGSASRRLVERLRRGQRIRDEDIYNVFERVLGEVMPEAVRLFERVAACGLGRPHLTGSGPALFLVPEGGRPIEPVLRELRSLGLEARETRALAAAEAAGWREE